MITYIVDHLTPVKREIDTLTPQQARFNFYQGKYSGSYHVSYVLDDEEKLCCVDKMMFPKFNKSIYFANGNFTVFPDYEQILKMKHAFSYLMGQAPVAYTLDIGVKWKEGGNETFVIECHDFYSCGLYGFSDLNKLPFMFNRWHLEHINKVKNKLS